VAENFSHARFGNAAGLTGLNYATWFLSALADTGSHFWTPLFTDTDRGHFVCTATGAEIVFIGTSVQFSVGYAPNGGIIDVSTTPTVASGPWTGMRNITSTTANLSLTSTQVWLAEHEDAITFIIGSSTGGMRWGCHVGHVMEHVDISDAALNIGKDAMIIGRMRNITTLGYWLSTSTFTNVHQTCVRVGNNFVAARANAHYVAANSNLDDIAGRIRLNATPMVLVNTANGISSYVGTTRYLRNFKLNFQDGEIIESSDPASQQAWLGWCNEQTTPNNNQCILWSKSPQVV
jgi:hypothetical protein